MNFMVNQRLEGIKIRKCVVIYIYIYIRLLKRGQRYGGYGDGDGTNMYIFIFIPYSIEKFGDFPYHTQSIQIFLVKIEMNSDNTQVNKFICYSY